MKMSEIGENNIGFFKRICEL